MARHVHEPPHRRPRRAALALLAWLNLVLQPALAASAMSGAGMEHCQHAGDCPAMLKAPCDTGDDAAVDTLRGNPAPPAAAWFRVDAAPDSVSVPARAVTPPATGPPLIIRFGHLRN